MVQEMNMQQHRRVRNLIKRLCANYQNGYCLPLDDGESCVCVQSVSFHLCCNYFKSAVLPDDSALEAEITSPNSTAFCRECNRPFIPRSNRNNQKYCPECAKRRHKESKAKSIAKAREKCRQSQPGKSTVQAVISINTWGVKVEIPFPRVLRYLCVIDTVLLQSRSIGKYL